jgi:3D (Asp-Asp-Asp) domain-containing protein/LysM repeat protein
MMKKSILLVSSIILLTNASASEKRLVDCRLVTPKTTECKPYPSKFMFTEKLTYDDTTHKLIISRTLPAGPKPKLIKVIKVEDMIEKHLEVLDPVRFSGSQPSPLLKSAAEIEEEKLEKEMEEAEVRQQMEKELAALKQKREQLKLEKERQKEAEADKKEIAEEEKKAEEEKEALEKKREKYAKYAVQSGDSLILIARRFKMTTKELLAENNTLKRESTLKIGQKIAIPLSQKEVDSIVKKRKKEKAKEKKQSKLAKSLEKKYRYLNKKTRNKMFNEYDAKLLKTLKGKHKLRVQATAYSSHVGQTDSTPFLAAWNNRIRPGMKIIAVSRDLITKYGLGNGKKVRIQGLPGYYTVRDKMNKRYTKRIDIYMGTNRRKALRWGRKRTVIYW